MTDLPFQSIAQLSAALDARTLDARALTRDALARIDGPGRALNAFVVVCRDTAVQAAEAAAARAAAGRRLGALDGIPVALKDNIDVAGLPTGNGFGGATPWRVPREDAEVTRRLRAAGAVILGKLAMHEGALGATNDNPHTGRTYNPHGGVPIRDGDRASAREAAPSLTPGGSSGGAGAAVAAGLCAAALGTDTGGSVRLPAAYCGVVGLKASYGLVSARGVVPLSYRLDHVGPLTRTVADAALMLQALAGFDPACPESRAFPPFVPAATPGALAGLRLGVLRNVDDEPPEPAIAAAFTAACGVLERLGAAIATVDLPDYDMARGRRALLVRVEVEGAFVHGTLLAREPERFSPAMRGFLEFGQRAGAQLLMQADRRIARAVHALERCFATVDAIVSPTAPQVAFGFDQKVPDNQSAYTALANFAGCPAISLPMGATADGRPIGLHVMAPVGREDRVLAIAAAYEAAADWQLVPPAPFGPAQPPR
jgi:aspartyl-tRNA(Asn)/glutamyl-tRNA(Gln) amidotransferase subunit A